MPMPIVGVPAALSSSTRRGFEGNQGKSARPAIRWYHLETGYRDRAKGGAFPPGLQARSGRCRYLLRKLSEEDKRVLLFLIYFSLTILFFPLGFVAWYALNRKEMTPYFPIAAMLMMFSFGSASYIYVYKPLLACDIDIGSWSVMVYGGMLSAHLFLVGFLCPNRSAGWFRLGSYLVSSGLLVLSVVSWSTIARYYLARGVDMGAAILGALGLAWICFLILANRYSPPIRALKRSSRPGNEKPVLVAVWLLTLGDLVVAKMIYNLCRLALAHK